MSAPGADDARRRGLRQLPGSTLGRTLLARGRDIRAGLRSRPRPPSTRSGLATGPPDFVGVGAQKSGTSWWFKSILMHPGIHAEAGKETHFFDFFVEAEFGAEEVDLYHRMFPRPAGSLSGEWTPRYMHDFWTPPMLHRAAPDAKILVLLRDPLSRFVSGIGHDVDRVLGSVRRHRRRYFEAMIVNDALQRSMYSAPLARLLKHYDRERVLVLQYEQCVLDCDAALQRTFEFLGVDPDIADPMPSSHRVGRPHAPFALPEAVRGHARAVLAKDAVELHREFPEIDLALWPTVGPEADSPSRSRPGGGSSSSGWNADRGATRSAGSGASRSRARAL